MIEYIIVMLISVLPWIELRGAIPVGIFIYGLDPVLVFSVSVIANILVIIPLFLFLEMFYDRFREYGFIQNSVKRARKRAAGNIRRYGTIGLALFVAIPLPVTGAWTGTLIAWLLGIERKKAFLSIGAGVAMAGLLVTLASVGILASIPLLT